MPYNPSNKELAEDYLIVAAQNARSKSSYITQTTRIADAEVNIRDFYDQHGNLTDLNVPGIGKKTKETLGLIMQYGPIEAMRYLRNKEGHNPAIRFEINLKFKRINSLEDAVRGFK